MAGVGENYFSAYAVFLKATTQQVGLLAALPPLLASFAQMLAVVLGQVMGIRKGIIVFGAVDRRYSIADIRCAGVDLVWVFDDLCHRRCGSWLLKLPPQSYG